MINAKIDLEKDVFELKCNFTSGDNFAEEVSILLNAIMNETAYRGCGGNIRNAEKAIEVFKDIIREGLKNDTCLHEYVASIED
ncbi:MAG: hypothetical protein K0R00_2615 [Herbinix sp.]|nr:hypothetical protein [Herbinix sp.]